MVSQPKGFFYYNTLKIYKIMKTLNSIAFEYLLRTDAQKNNNKPEEKIQTIGQNQEQYTKGQQSLLFRMYELEEEDVFFKN